MGLLLPGASCLLAFPASKISELEIDVDKDWLVFGITNLKEVTAGMAKGDVPYFNGTIMAGSSPGTIGSVLTSHDFGNDPTWEYPP